MHLEMQTALICFIWDYVWGYPKLNFKEVDCQ
jgi:hypothetical protein